MGDPFLRKYYTIHDMEEPAKIGLVGVASSTRKYFSDTGLGEPDSKFSITLGGITITDADSALLEIVAGVIASILFCCFIYCVQSCL